LADNFSDGHRSTRRSAIWPTAAISAFLHLAVIVAIGLLPAKPPAAVPQVQSISVEILTEPQASRPEMPAPPQRASPADEARKETKPVGPAGPAPEQDGMVRAQQLFSARILADPRSKAAVAALGQLAGEDRIIQLCNVETMEQVRRWKSLYRPDFVVAYATAGARLSGLTLEADGAAFRSKRLWYSVKFKCQLTPDLQKVAAFEFAVGPAIPEREWAAHSLPVGNDGLD
jgi:hypothetical protein